MDEDLETANLPFDCPQQDNDNDCGVFHLLNLSLLVEGEDSVQVRLASIRQCKRCEENKRIHPLLVISRKRSAKSRMSQLTREGSFSPLSIAPRKLR